MVVLECHGVTVRRGGRTLLDGVDWSVRAGEQWVVIGPNGAGKTTLLSIAAGRLFPTSGTVRILDEELGAVDLAELRPRIGWASAAIASEFPPQEAVLDVVMTGAHAVSGRWREEYTDVDVDRARHLLQQWGIADIANRTFGTLSEGERKRTMMARAVMADPELLLLDEPGAGLDLGGRESLMTGLSALARDPSAPTMIMVTHHVEDIPAGTTHAMLLDNGRIRASGPIEHVVTDAHLTEVFAIPIRVETVDGRRFAISPA